MTRPLPSKRELRRLFDYDPQTGILTHKPRPRRDFAEERIWKRFNTLHAGKPAGHVEVTHSGRRVMRTTLGPGTGYYLLHRIVWKWMLGIEPLDTLDHADRDATNNRWNNIRPATGSQSTHNSGRTRNKTGYRGVTKNTKGKKYAAVFMGTHLGSFDTPEAAHKAYRAAAKAHYKEYFYD